MSSSPSHHPLHQAIRDQNREVFVHLAHSTKQTSVCLVAVEECLSKKWSEWGVEVLQNPVFNDKENTLLWLKMYLKAFGQKEFIDSPFMEEFVKHLALTGLPVVSKSCELMSSLATMGLDYLSHPAWNKHQVCREGDLFEGALSLSVDPSLSSKPLEVQQHIRAIQRSVTPEEMVKIWQRFVDQNTIAMLFEGTPSPRSRKMMDDWMAVWDTHPLSWQIECITQWSKMNSQHVLWLEKVFPEFKAKMDKAVLMHHVQPTGGSPSSTPRKM